MPDIPSDGSLSPWPRIGLNYGVILSIIYIYVNWKVRSTKYKVMPGFRTSYYVLCTVQTP